MHVIHLLLAISPYLCLAGLIGLWQAKHPDADIFDSLAAGSLIWSCLVWLASYGLSWLDLLTSGWLAAIWLAISCYLATSFGLSRATLTPERFSPWLWPIFLIALCAFMAAVFYPPNIHDALTYHMPRIMHWLQNHSMAPYPTNIDRQIGMAPFNAMIALQSLGASGLDAFVNLGQWLAFLGCIAAAGSLAKTLGGGKSAIRASVIFAATLPAAIVQASNTDSCLLVSFYICVAVNACLKWLAAPAPDWRQILIFAFALGFAILSKGSAYPIMLPFVCLVAWKCVTHMPRRFMQGLAAACVILALNLPHFIYTTQATGNLVGSAEGNIITRPSPALFTANIICNTLANAPFLLAGSGREFWTSIARRLGYDGANEAILPWGGLEAVKSYMAPIDGITPNPLHLVFILITLCAAIWPRFRPPLVYGATMAFSVFFFCLLLTWHPWMARIQLPLFLLCAPVCGLFASRLSFPKIRLAIVLCFYLAAIPPAILCVERPLAPASWLAFFRDDVKHFLSAPREALLFNYAPHEYRAYQEAADVLAAQRPDEVELDIGANGIEYPVWVLLRNRVETMPVIGHIGSHRPMPAYVWSKPRHNTEQPQPLRIIKNSAAGARILYPPMSDASGVEKKAHE